MQKSLTIVFLFFFSFISTAQKKNIVEKDSIVPVKHLLKGKIFDSKTKQVLQHAHVINLNAVTGATSNEFGDFSIYVTKQDTLHFSYLGYQSIKLPISKSTIENNNLQIPMTETPVELDEVHVKPYELTGVLEIDSKNIPLNDFAHIHINGLPQTFETGAPVTKKYNSPLDAVFHPIDFMYELFGKKPKQLRKLKKLRKADELREILEHKANREVLIEYLEMDVGEINTLLDYCNYSDYFINNASDLQVIEAVIECYENYKALKLGNTDRQ